MPGIPVHTWHAGHPWHSGHTATLHHLLELLRHGHLLHARQLAHHAHVLSEAAHHLAHEQVLLHHLGDPGFLCARALGNLLTRLGSRMSA
ncbi:MAG: hypothetical protein U0165_03055 [Polyangiaceae bacterium]